MALPRENALDLGNVGSGRRIGEAGPSVPDVLLDLFWRLPGGLLLCKVVAYVPPWSGLVV